MDNIEELKKLLWILDSKHNVSIPQTKENIDFIADEIVKLFCQPAVISSVCDIHKGTRCEKSLPSYIDGKCRECGGQAN